MQSISLSFSLTGSTYSEGSLIEIRLGGQVVDTIRVGVGSSLVQRSYTAPNDPSLFEFRAMGVGSGQTISLSNITINNAAVDLVALGVARGGATANTTTATFDRSNERLEIRTSDALQLPPVPQDSPLNVINGTSANDRLFGTTGDDTVNALEGDDIAYANAGNDLVNGGLGSDRLFGGDGNDTINGDDGNDFLYGENGDDIVNGGVGDDIIYGHDGIDQLNGGDGFDRLYGGLGQDVIRTGAGHDMAYGNEDNDTIYGEDGDDRLYGNEGNDVIDGGNGSDRLFGDVGDDQLDAGAGDDFLYGGDGNDVMNGGDGADRFFGGIGNDTLNGGIGNDVMAGEAGDDILNGGDGDDLMYGALGLDTIRGGIGNDQIFGNEDVDTIYGDDGNDRIHAGTGADLVYGGLGNDNIAGNEDNDRLYGDDGDDQLFGELGDDQLWGGIGNDRLVGNEGNDTLRGEDGDDTLDGGDGNDVFDGGIGIDTVIYASATAGVTVRLSTTANQNTGGAGTDRISNVENLTGSNFNDTLMGNTNNNILNGGLGIDTVSYDNATAAVTVSLAVLTAQNTVGAGLDTLSGFENLTGSDFNDTLTGSIGDNLIDGGTGNDTINAGDGNDTVIGGAGNDVMNGGAGTNTLSYVGTTGAVTISLAVATAQVTGGSGTDTISNFINMIGGSGGDRFTGNAQDNRMEGMNGADRLIGGAGSDTLIGGTGDDELYAFDTTPANGEDRTSVNLLEGGDGNDDLYGSSGTDTLLGGNGTDVIRSGSGTVTSIADILALVPGLEYNAVTGNFYLYVGTGANWADANADATSRLLGGQAGYLATIISGNENNFVRDLGSGDKWLGGTDSVVEGQWRWTGGELESGDQFTQIDASRNGYYENFGGATNANSATRDYLEQRNAGGWNNEDGSVSNAYVIEWDGAHILGVDNTTILDGGAGNDDLYGAAGRDVFRFTGTTGIDDIFNFDVSADAIDISDLLSSYDPISDNINDFVQLTRNANDMRLFVDSDGAGGAAAVQIALIQDHTGLNVNDLLANGTMIV